MYWSSSVLKTESPIPKMSSEHDSMNHTEGPCRKTEGHVNVPKKAEHIEYTVISITEPVSLSVDTFTVVNRDTEEIVVKQEPLDWLDSEPSCSQDKDSAHDKFPTESTLGSSEDCACDRSSSSCPQKSYSRASFKVRLKDLSVPEGQMKTEPQDFSSDSFFHVSEVKVKTEPVDASSDSLFEKHTYTAEEIAGDIVDDDFDRDSTASDLILDGTSGRINSSDDQSSCSEGDDNEIEVLPIYFSPKCSDSQSDKEKEGCLDGTVKCEIYETQVVSRSFRKSMKSRPPGASRELRVKDKKSGPKRKLKYQPSKCAECGREFANPKYLRSHMRVHSDIKPYTCDECPSAFVRPADLKRHKKTHTGEKAFKCKLCKSAFADSCKLKIHMRIHTGERPYKCEICEQSFSQPSQYSRHKRVHKGERPYQCPYCPSSFTMTSDYRRHLKIHTGERPFVCEYCPARFPEAKNLKVHIRIHTGEKPYKCDLCNASFAQAANLSRHIRTHTGERPAKCELCPSSFADKHKLRVHMRSHSGEKPYRCVMCPAAFATSSSLNRHKVMHSGKKPFRCEDCPGMFSHMSKLRLHMVCHSLNGPFQCPHCTASFRNNYGLTVHSHVHESA